MVVLFGYIYSVIGNILLFNRFLSEDYHGMNQWVPNPLDLYEEETINHLLSDH